MFQNADPVPQTVIADVVAQLERLSMRQLEPAETRRGAALGARATAGQERDYNFGGE